MIFINKSNNKRVAILACKANDLLWSDRFAAKMHQRKSFNGIYTSSIAVSGAYVLKRLRDDESEVEIYTYRSKNPWTSSNGYTLQDGKTRIFLNTRKFGRSDASILATIFHEAVHEADNNDPDHFYHHGDNYPKGGTAPEVVADIVYEIESGLPSEQDSSVKKKKPWWMFWK